MHNVVFEIEKALDTIGFYDFHPEYRPFIGKYFDKYRILQVGESHYIGQSKDYAPYSLEAFHEWWTDACTIIYEHPDGDPETKCWGSWYNTCDVVGRFFKNNQKNYSIFSNPLKVFQDVCLQNLTEQQACDNSRQAYHYFAFMNFFQMPALYKGESFWKSLCMADKHPRHELAYSVYEKATEISSGVVDDVIKAIQPKVVVFTSSSAWSAYKKYGEHVNSEDSPVMIHTAHPGCCWWNRKTKDGTSSRECLETALKKVFLK